ncbi:MAG: copper resistance protein CopC [Actinomycetia bacterium]|nr:copper resistance protein CopC [Actinomycetes bacterium]
MANSRSLTRPGFRGILFVLAAAILLVLPTGPAAGHSYLRESTPAQDADLQQLPAEVTLAFSDAILETGIGLTLLGPDGAVPLAAEPAKKSVAAPWPAVSSAAGDYTLEYRVVSQDGHVMSGAVNFAVTPQAAAAANPTDLPPDSGRTEDLPAEAAETAETSETVQSAGADTAPQSVPVWLLAAGILLALGAIVVVLRRRNGAH